MKTFNVEILGYEYSIYGGADGHYCGTNVTPNRVVDFLELSEEYADMQVYFHEDWRDLSVSFSFHEIHEYHYWAPQSYRALRNPITNENGWMLNKELFDKLICKKLGWTEGYRKGHFEEYYECRKDFLRSRITLKELQDLLS